MGYFANYIQCYCIGIGCGLAINTFSQMILYTINRLYSLFIKL